MGNVWVQAYMLLYLCDRVTGVYMGFITQAVGGIRALDMRSLISSLINMLCLQITKWFRKLNRQGSNSTRIAPFQALDKMDQAINKLIC